MSMITLATDLVHPDVGGHDLVLEVHVDELGELEAQPDSEGLCEVGNWSDETVVVVEQVIIQSLGMRIALNT